MAGRWVRGLLHLLVGGACAALVAWLGFGFTQTVLTSDGPTRVAMAALSVLSAAVVVTLLLAPPVRTAEVALARGLLRVDLPDPADTTSWEARRRGLLWALVVLVLGATSLLALLWCVPQGIALLLGALDPGAVDDALSEWRLDLPPWGLGVLGAGVLAVGIGVQPLLVVALERLAVAVLGPTAADRLAHAERERERLLAANTLAREIHDSVGHALTAIGVQAEAGARVAATDPAFARDALTRIAATTHGAVAELDEVLGALRDGTARDGTARDVTARRGAGLARVVEVLGPVGPRGSGAVTVEAGSTLDDDTAHAVHRVVQEGLTNARRHGSGEPSGHVRVADDRVEVLLENPVSAGAGGTPAQRRRRGGLGLVGMHERLTMLGGELAAGPADGPDGPVWRLEASVPIPSTPPGRERR